jgi:hypothetical protein
MTPDVWTAALHSPDLVVRFGVWLLLNLIPFSVFGMLLAWVGFHTERPHGNRLLMGALVAGLLVSTSCTTAEVFANRWVVILDHCKSWPPEWPMWLWWATCAL